MTAADRTNPTAILTRLTEYFEPKQNTIYQRYLFNTCSQGQGERFDSYLNKLRTSIKSCEYGALEDELLRDRIVLGTNNKNLQSRFLSESSLTLDKAIDTCRSNELAEQQLGRLSINPDPKSELINFTKSDRKRPPREHIKDCRWCGQDHKKGKCQAYGLTCAICGKQNHIAKVCRSRDETKDSQQRPYNKQKTQRSAQVRYVENETASSDESIYALGTLLDTTFRPVNY